MHWSPQLNHPAYIHQHPQMMCHNQPYPESPIVPHMHNGHPSHQNSKFMPQYVHPSQNDLFMSNTAPHMPFYPAQMASTGHFMQSSMNCGSSSNFTTASSMMMVPQHAHC